ncbi:multicopper oxidase family protein [Nocardioides limicola]|uniref:multicopper oxidase family protein n=1 Tax=Nocardioides limicola TaxID=2803368 RepID=UPI00193BEB73|nr:multicopper oxidase family protein [Nocardioides sp. DJM-14]
MISRRGVVLGSLLSVAAVGCTRRSESPRLIGPDSSEVFARERARQPARQAVVNARLQATPATVDLGERVVETWTYNGDLPGPTIRATAGDLLRVDVTNDLPAQTSIHWHGIALRNDMDGVPGLTQDPIDPEESFRYEFTVPDAGTYFFHSHSGVQLDRGLYGTLIVEDPDEPGGYDDEWVVVLDDWLDGTGRTPDDTLATLLAQGDHAHRMPGMGGARTSVLGPGGDVDYPYYLINGRTSGTPATFTGKPGARIRLRIVNAAADTAFRVALGGHRLTVTHSDGFPVSPVTTEALVVGMGERFDALVDLGDGQFPLVAAAEGKTGAARAVVSTAAGDASDGPVNELSGRVLLGTGLVGTEGSRLASRAIDRTLDIRLGGGMHDYRWTLNGASFPDSEPLLITAGERVRLRFRNQTMMFHPMHLHGHTVGLASTGARKDTVTMGPMSTLEVDVEADNPGQWALHCHNAYHAEAGMMMVLGYRR